MSFKIQGRSCRSKYKEVHPVNEKGTGARWILAILFALTLLISGAISQSVPIDAAKSTDEQEIYAAVIRSQMEQWIRAGDKSEAEAKDESDRSIARHLNFRTFFVSIDGEDPSDDFIDRFRDIPRIVKKISSAEPDKGPHTPVDKSTHQTGIIFSADSLRWSSKNSAKVEGGYYCGGLCAAGITFKVRRENGKWVVKSSHMNWIS
jgi:hypothetical protein